MLVVGIGGFLVYMLCNMHINNKQAGNTDKWAGGGCPVPVH
jgi:hypothetical protein